MTTVLESLNQALHGLMQADRRVVLLGEDLDDPYGGAFKVTRGLSSAYPERVFSSPISEAGLVGIAAGMALRGLRPVVEIMFGDFLTLAADQLINHAAKYRWMYNDQARVPLVVRTPMGGRRGYGPTHSQTLEKHFLGAPGLRVLAPTALGNPGELLRQAVLQDDDPVLFIENKLLYLSKLPDETVRAEFDIEELIPHRGDEPAWRSALSPASYTPAYRVRLRGAPQPSLTLVAYGYMAELARQALQELAYQDEIFAELIVLTQLSPFEIEPVLTSTRTTSRVLIAEEGTAALGWGAEIAARLAESAGTNLKIKRLAAADTPIPAAGSLESAVLPGVTELRQAAYALLGT